MKVVNLLFVSLLCLFTYLQSNAQSTHYLNYDGWYFSGIRYPISIYGVKENKTSLDVPSSVIDPGYVNSWTTVGRLSAKIFSLNGGYWSKIKTATTATIPSTITEMGTSVFENNSVIKSVTVNASIDIPNNTFAGCTALETVKWASAETIGTSAFKGCVSLKSMDFLPNSITSYAANSFYASGLEMFNFKNKTISIGESAFENVIIPDFLSFPRSLTTISSKAFAGCTGINL